VPTSLPPQNASLEQLLLECSLELLREPDQAAFFERLVSGAARLLETPDAYLYLLAGEQIESKVALGVHAPLKGLRLNKGQGMGGVVWERGQSLLVDDYDRWPLRAPKFPEGLLHSVLGVPVRLEGQVVGVLGVTCPDPTRRFDQSDEAVLERFVQVAELALKHYQLAADLKTQRDEAERLLNTLSEAVVQTDKRFVISYLNPAWEQLLGRKVADCIGKSFLEFVYPEDRTSLLEAAKQLVSQPSMLLEYRVLHIEGEVRWVRSRTQIEHDEEGQFTSTNSILTDITQQQLDEQALRQSEQRQNQLLQSLGETIVQTNREGIITYVNPAWETMTGFRINETLGRPYFQFVFAEDQPAVVHLIRQARDQGDLNRRLEYRLVTKNGSLRWINSKGNWLRGADGRILGMTGVLTDIHARREAETALLESRERFRQLLDTIEGVVWEAESDKGNTFLSSQVAQRNGSPTPISGINISTPKTKRPLWLWMQRLTSPTIATRTSWNTASLPSRGAISGFEICAGSSWKRASLSACWG
jgi:PAS domain S-box-containing protein